MFLCMLLRILESFSSIEHTVCELKIRQRHCYSKTVNGTTFSNFFTKIHSSTYNSFTINPSSKQSKSIPNYHISTTFIIIQTYYSTFNTLFHLNIHKPSFQHHSPFKQKSKPYIHFNPTIIIHSTLLH